MSAICSSDSGAYSAAAAWAVPGRANWRKAASALET
jgi:hypothetical protein